MLPIDNDDDFVDDDDDDDNGDYDASAAFCVSVSFFFPVASVCSVVLFL